MDNKTKSRKAGRYEVSSVADPKEKEQIIRELVKSGGAFSDLDPRVMAAANEVLFVAAVEGSSVGFAGLNYRREPTLRTDTSLIAADMGTGELGFTILDNRCYEVKAYSKLLEARISECICRWL